jgi:hypothetical protein
MTTRVTLRWRVMIGSLALLVLLGTDAPAKDKKLKFLLTQSSVPGDQALTACPIGFHMASLWEIFNLSNFQYDPGQGHTADDSGSGPPAGSPNDGWIRVGGNAEGGGVGAGVNNCNAWTSKDNGDSGTTVLLQTPWFGIPSSPISPWVALNSSCDAARRVWCVED